jgi:hypothetical protein
MQSPIGFEISEIWQCGSPRLAAPLLPRWLPPIPVCPCPLARRPRNGAGSHGVRALVRTPARRGRDACLSTFLPQNCHPRPLHPNRAARAARTSRAAGANLGGRRMAPKSDTYADLSVDIRVGTLRGKGPASLASRLATRGEGPAKRGANATEWWPPRDGMWVRRTERPTRPRTACVTGLSSDGSGVPSGLRFALYASINGSRNPEIWRRELRPTVAPVAYRCLPPPGHRATRARGGLAPDRTPR